jgi:hypothetical protein
MQLGILSCNPIILGLHFLQHEPLYFRCKSHGQWTECSKTQICQGNYDDYLAIDDVKRDPEFIDNWVVQMNLLCKPAMVIGLIGVSFFLGVCLAMFFVPQYAELNGKKDIFLLSLIISLIG